MLNYFDRLVLDIVSQIPEGKVTTYGEIAKALGDIRAARAVGEALKKNPKPVEIPCHRVVMSDGSLGGYAFGGPEKKKKILKREGITFRNGKVDLKAHLITHEEFKAPKIFERMKGAQNRMREKIVVEEPENVKIAVGVDVSYWEDFGVGAAVVVDRSGRVIETRTWVGNVLFPYVPTYLAFREMPFVWNVLRDLEFDVVLVDGHGWIHPRRMGEATHFGVVLDMPTVGVAKSRLVGREENGKIFVNGKHVGWKVGKAYVSPGNRMSVEGALRVARAFWKVGKQPLPLLLAHKTAVTKMREERERRELHITTERRVVKNTTLLRKLSTEVAGAIRKIHK